jgi:S-layer homology domain
VLKDSELFVVRLDAAGTDVVDTSIHITDEGRLRTAVQGPSGDLYLAQDASPGSILRVTPGPGSSCASAPFPDVPSGHAFCADIQWLADEGIAAGYPDGTFRPTALVSRQSMAAFLYRIAGEPTVTLPAPFFSDVPSSQPFYEPIQWLAQAEIATGIPDPPGKPLFRPGEPVSRGAMAAFLFRFGDYLGDLGFTAPAVASFPDVPTSYVFFTEVEWLVAEGITGGFADGRYHPAASVSRQAMAAFLHRADGVWP